LQEAHRVLRSCNQLCAEIRSPSMIHLSHTRHVDRIAPASPRVYPHTVDDVGSEAPRRLPRSFVPPRSLHHKSHPHNTYEEQGKFRPFSGDNSGRSLGPVESGYANQIPRRIERDAIIRSCSIAGPCWPIFYARRSRPQRDNTGRNFPRIVVSPQRQGPPIQPRLSESRRASEPESSSSAVIRGLFSTCSSAT